MRTRDYRIVKRGWCFRWFVIGGFQWGIGFHVDLRHAWMDVGPYCFMVQWYN